MQLYRLLIIGSLWLLPAFSHADECLDFALPGGDLIDHKVAEYAQRSFEAYGVCVNITVLPAVQATKQLLNGSLDGEIARIEDYVHQVGHVALKVPSPVMFYKTFMLTGDQSVETISDIDRPDVTVGIVRGWTWMEKLVSQFRFAKIRVVDEQMTLIEMLDKGRLDVIFLGADVIDAHDMDGRYKCVPMGHYAHYIWLHKDNASLVTMIDKAIIAFTREHGLKSVTDSFLSFRTN